MLHNHDWKLSGLILPFVVFIVLNGCTADKRTVNPYPDRSYTSSAARVKENSKSSEKPAISKPEESNTALRPEDRGMTSLPREISAKSMLPLLTMVDDRIVVYESKVEQWNGVLAEASGVALDQVQRDTLQSCLDQVKSILSGYEELHQQLISASSGETADASVISRSLAIQRQDINFLEGECRQVPVAEQKAGSWIVGTMDRLLEEKEREIHEKMISGEYLQVIDLYGQLPLQEGQHPSYDTVFSYGQALLRSGRENDAAEVFRNLLVNLQEQDQIDREFKLMQLIADIQFGLENYDAAFERYIHIINRYAGLGENIDWARKQQSMISARNSQGLEVRNYAELTRAYLTYNPERDAFKVFLLARKFTEDFPSSSVIPAVTHMLYESRDRAEAWFAGVMQRIATLRGEKKYQEALQLVANLPLPFMPQEKKDQLDQLTAELTAASLTEQESRKAALEEALQEEWSKGLNFLQAKDYDQAIQVFSGLLETGYGEQAKDKIQEASLLAAQEDRRAAAELYVQATRTGDRNEKTVLLMKSRQLLKDILAKYPQSGLVEKVQRNLDKIEEDIKAIDPSLLNEPEAGGQGADPTQASPQATTINGIPLGQWQEQVR